MMGLRSRNVNVPEQSNGAAPLKRQAAKNSKAALIEDVANEEPKAKRAALSDLSQVRQAISGVVLDSAKKTKGDAKNASKRRGLSTIDNKNSIPIKTQVDQKSKAKPALRPVVEAAAVQEEVDPCPEYDFDKENAKDITALSEFARDIFRYYKQRESQFKVGNYIGQHAEIDETIRATIVDWLVELQEQFELNHETLYLAVKLIDMYLDRQKNVKQKKLQLIGCAAVFIASKFDERSAPLIDDFLYMSDDSFSRDDLVQMERDLFAHIGYDLGAPLSYRFLRRYARVNKTDMATLTLARYILETSLLFLDFCRVSESLIASAALMLALRMKDLTGWTPALQKYSGYKENEVEPLMLALNHMMARRKAGEFAYLATITNKYSHELFYEVAFVDPLEDPITGPIVSLPKELLQAASPSNTLVPSSSKAQQNRRR